MSSFFTSLREDLLDRRLAPFVALVAVALVAALAYALLGGSSSPAPSVPPPSASVPTGLSVSETKDTSRAAVAETTSGASLQRKGAAHNPFSPLPGVSSTVSTSSVTATASSSGSGSSSSSGSKPQSSGSGGSSSGGSPPSERNKSPQKPKKVVIHFKVSAQFGALPMPIEGAPAAAPQLKTYASLKLHEPLPAGNPQLVYLGVVLSTGNEAVFGLTGEAILHGEARCLPSTQQCQSIALKAGQSETLEGFEADGKPVTYELKLLTITKQLATGSAAHAHSSAVRPSRRELAMIHRAGLRLLSGLRYTYVPEGLMPMLKRKRAHLALTATPVAP
jgi:hypothetical protein